MAQILIRNLNDDVKQRLKKRAVEHGISMEAEARLILTSTLKAEKPSTPGLGSLIAARFGGVGLDEPLPELHDQRVSPMDL